MKQLDALIKNLRYGTTGTDKLSTLHVSRMSDWIKSLNLALSVQDIKMMTALCSVCAELKPQEDNVLNKTTIPFLRD